MSDGLYETCACLRFHRVYNVNLSLLQSTPWAYGLRMVISRTPYYATEMSRVAKLKKSRGAVSSVPAQPRGSRFGILRERCSGVVDGIREMAMRNTKYHSVYVGMELKPGLGMASDSMSYGGTGTPG